MKLKTRSGEERVIETLGELLALMKPRDAIAVTAKTAFIFLGTVEDWYKLRPDIDSYYNDSMEDRKVKRLYRRDLMGEPRMLVIDIEGEENGPVWLLSEMPMAAKKYKRIK